MYSVSDKVALVTGGSRGIGLALCRRILEQGGKVGVNGRNETEDAFGLQREFGNDRVALIWGDVSKPDEAMRTVEEVAKAFGRLDVLVHAAGGPAPGKITELSQADWMEAFDIHVHPVFHLFKAAHPHLKKEGGAVVLVSSVAGLRGCPGTVAYQTVKGALIPLARALAFDHGPENIRVNVIAPGIIRTRFHEAMTEEAKTHNIGSRIPLRREGTVEDVARAILELIENDFITGEVLTIDGGMSMRVTG
ncbi:SDR family oxidoreductase [Chelativorans sp. AA-79]|uniref:SDR family NAD(P)-dependent oxidoreductase n=1 Tax=Chelativorans sp. AA-79 TaxID=3028735 RepID=UPI0023FA015C|nr:SDR family oxidoreductase [Chelativorans sp. AA-79]WEX11838.1 SDR family NAD(P)-dependent oxidoreductase [Chelativorans sp. AA-79]